MPNLLDRIADSVLRKMQGMSPIPSRAVLRQLLETVYLATLRTEEGKPIRGAITFADPSDPNPDFPMCCRAHYPLFTTFDHPFDFNVSTLVKLSRAIDSWAGAIVVYGAQKSEIKVWGVLDQLVHRNIRLHHESRAGFSAPGILSVHMEGIAALSVYHGDLFLAGLQQDRVIFHETDAFGSNPVRNWLTPVFEPIAQQIALAIGNCDLSARIQNQLLQSWSSTISRICIGLRRLQTGGAFLITPEPHEDLLKISNPLPYRRLSQAAILSVLDSSYYRSLDIRRILATEVVRREDFIEQSLAETDFRDRELELAGAVRLVSSLAAVDGLVLLKPTLEISGFGVKIRSDASIGDVYDGPGFSRRGTRAKLVDVGGFGTRHGSMLQYCRMDERALGIIVSQDGNVRMVMRIGPHLTFWDNVKLLQHYSDYQQYLEAEQRRRQRREQGKGKRSRGYTRMPKTLDELMELRNLDGAESKE